MQPRSEYAASIVHSRHSLSGGGRTTWDAAAVSREGLAAIAPFVDRHAQTFRDLAHRLRRDYLSACENAGAEPDEPLLDRVAHALGAPVNRTR